MTKFQRHTIDAFNNVARELAEMNERLSIIEAFLVFPTPKRKMSKVGITPAKRMRKKQ
jgi:hypothetical protein